MYHEDDELNRLHEFMREEAEAREEQSESYSDTETIAIASTLHKEDY
jgi:hypothetical protein